MSLPIYPKLIGESYPVVKRSPFNTISSQASSGVEVRVGEWLYPLSEWDIPYSWLSEEAAISDYQKMKGFMLSAYGGLSTFLYSDPTDNTTSVGRLLSPPVMTPAIMGTGNGSQVAFQIGRTVGSFYEPLYDIDSTDAAPLIYLNGSLASPTISATGLVTFGSAPGSGVIITADFQYYWRCKFGADYFDIENFVNNWWDIQKVTIKQVRV